MGAAILGMQATVGLLVAKALTSSANPYYQQMTPGYSPVLALDVFLVQVLVQIQFLLSDIKVLLTTSSWVELHMEISVYLIIEATMALSVFNAHVIKKMNW